MRSVFQQNGQPSTPSCPARETRGQAETTDEETSSTLIRTQPKAEKYRVTTQNSLGKSCWTRRVTRGPRHQRIVLTTLAVHPYRRATGNPIQERYNFTLHEMTASTFTEMVRYLYRQQTTAFKIDLSFGFILRNIETGVLRYYHSSQNNARLFDVPHLIRTEEDLERSKV